MKIKYKPGDKVMAKWPGTSLYFHATIKSVDHEEESAEVEYEDGTDMEIPITYVTTEKTFRKRSKSRERRPRSRSHSRSKSPARSPARKAVQRKAATPTRKSARGRPANKSSFSSSTAESSSEETKVPPSPTRTTVTKSRRFDQTDFEQKEGYEKVTTRSYQAKIVVEKVDDNQSMTSQAQERANESITAARATIETAKKSIQRKYEFGGPLGALFQYVITPIAIIIFVTTFKATKCELMKFNLKQVSQDWKTYFDPVAVLITLQFLMFHALLYALPLGKTVEGPRTYSGRKTEYRISAFYTLFLTIVAYCALLYVEFPVLIVIDKMLPIAATCCVGAFLINFALHIKSYFADEDELNPAANTGNPIYDLFMGRELHPRLGRFYQIKLLIYRPAMTGWVLVNLIYLRKEFLDTGTIRPALGIVAGVQIIYCVAVFFWDEAQAIYSFDIKNEGLGFQNLIGNLAIVPFIYTSHVRYILEHPKAPLVSLPILAVALIALVLGLALVTLSMYQKMYFRQNPYDPSLSALDSIPPSKKGGRRLIVSGYWGFVRHPNYLGEILLGLGYGLMCGLADPFPWVYFVFVTGLLCHRALRDEERCHEVHGYSWTEYCRRVPYRVIPYVF